MAAEQEQLLPPGNDATTHQPPASEAEGGGCDGGGLSAGTAIVFVVGDVIGAGIITLPYAMKLVGYVGVPMFLFCSAIMCYCGILLARACTIVMRSIPDRSELRDPYPRVSQEAAGKAGFYLTTVALTMNQLMTCIVFLLISGETLIELMPDSPWAHMLVYRGQLQVWFAICALFLLPFTFLGTPKDFTGIGVLATLTSAVALVLIMIMLVVTSQSDKIDNSKTSQIKFEGALHSFGTVLFGFGGVSIFPTIQADMKRPDRFEVSIAVGYAIVTTIYIVVPLLSYVLLGDMVREDLLTTFTNVSIYHSSRTFRVMCMASQSAICAHVLCAFIMYINPVYQQFEGLLNIPTSFGYQRVLHRTFVMIIILAAAVIVPNFGPVLSFVGGTFAALLGIIMPVVCYARLVEEKLPRWREAILCAILIVAVLGSLGNGYVEIKNIYYVVTDKYHHQ